MESNQLTEKVILFISPKKLGLFLSAKKVLSEDSFAVVSHKGNVIFCMIIPLPLSNISCVGENVFNILDHL